MVEVFPLGTALLILLKTGLKTIRDLYFFSPLTVWIETLTNPVFAWLRDTSVFHILNYFTVKTLY